ncbi:flagellar associated [Micractinium conductrix]|uniref:Flagellar associated n=1 Tax=Micractinium conductrix TaxID=554055 RepID=A0A2P6V863_9CHLO|nr:flagellar associated [Micractinium conductrix]|eukprot:PSC70271.1 flagellar associated [Micractinium conductrix]
MELLQRIAADIRGTASAPTSPARFVGSALTVKPGYLTSSAAATAPVAERFATASAASTAAAASRSAGNSPVAAAATTTAGAGAAACLRDSPPAWAGPRASQRAVGQHQHQRFSKDDAYLHALDQHSRGRLPGCTTHKPQHSVTLEQAAPTNLTTWGAASQEALRWSLPPEGATHGIKSSLMGFFSAGSGTDGGFVSENGLAEAARYHETSRPMEGRMKTAQPSRTTARGAPFAG